MKFIKNLADNLEKYICQITMAALLVIIFGQTVLRYVFHAAQPWPEEVSCFLLIWLVFFSSGYATQQDAHIGIDSVLGLYPKKIRGLVDIFSMIIWIALCGLVVYIGAKHAISLKGMGTRASSVAWIKMWVVYLGIPAGYALMLIRVVQKLIGKIKALKNPQIEESAADEEVR